MFISIRRKTRQTLKEMIDKKQMIKNFLCSQFIGMKNEKD